MMFVSPTSFRNLVTTSSNLSWPDSTHARCRMVCEMIFLPAPRTTASSGGFGLAMSGAGDLSSTGTLRCLSTLAAAEVEMGLAARLGGGSAGATGPFGDGMVMVSWHDGHSMSVPAPELSTASSCSQLGQLKTISISVGGFGVTVNRH